jgi:hypothetical protein
MSYVLFALGLLLAAIGGMSIYDGYGIITLERGWAETIAGATVLTGGIVTIALAMILRRLKILCDLYAAASQPLVTPDTVAVEPPPLAVSPVAVEPPLPLEAPTPSIGAAQAIPGVLRPSAPRAMGQSRAKPFVKPAKPLYPEPEPVRELALVSDTATVETQPEAAAPYHTPADETAIAQRSRPATALSLDEMWKRVTDEIERPILPSGPGATRAPESEAVAAVSKSSWESPVEEPEAPTESLYAEEPAPVAEPEPVDVEHIEIASTAETYAGGAFLSEEESMDAGYPDIADAEATDPEPHPHMPPPVEPPVAEPAVIGRYEAEGTAYLMFDNGSIEAQSEAGVFHFASMAELKAFIEEKQAAEP